MRETGPRNARDPDELLPPDQAGGLFPSSDRVPNPDQMPNLYEGILLKRVFGYLIDLAVLLVLGFVGWMILMVAGLLTFGLLWGVLPLFGALLPICYHGFLVGGPRSATLGMRIVGIHVLSIDGQRPTPLQAFIMAAAFYTTVPFTSFLILAVALFNPRRRTVHDWLSGAVVVNRLT